MQYRNSTGYPNSHPPFKNANDRRFAVGRSKNRVLHLGVIDHVGARHDDLRVGRLVAGCGAEHGFGELLRVDFLGVGDDDFVATDGAAISHRVDSPPSEGCPTGGVVRARARRTTTWIERRDIRAAFETPYSICNVLLVRTTPSAFGVHSSGGGECARRANKRVSCYLGSQRAFYPPVLQSLIE